jgi:hypothetical protein
VVESTLEPGSSEGAVKEEATAAQSARARLSSAGAQLLAWTALALLNQILILVALPAASGLVGVLHHAYDAGFLLVPGVVSWLAVRAVEVARARLGLKWLERRLGKALLFGAGVLAIGLLTGSGDVSSFAERTGYPQWGLTFALALIFAVPLGATCLLPRSSHPAWRGAQASLGLALAVVNGLTLPNDYFACHLMGAWLAALLVARALEGSLLSAWKPRTELALVCVAALGGLLAVALPAKGDVRVRLYELPSSVLPPLLSGLLSDEQRLEVELVPQRYRESAWFRDRRGLPDVPPTRAVVPSKPPIVLFFTVDAFRADLLENEEHKKSLPELVRLRSVSTYFTRARSPTASTLTTMSTVFAGKYYSQMQWNRSNPKHPLLEPTPRFPELVSAAGVHTLFVAGSQGRLSGSYGVGVGFKKEVNVPRVKPATGNVDAIIAELEQVGDAPLFVYAHFIEPHMPYDLAGKKGTPFERYLREVALVDRQLKRLRQFLERRGLAERTYLLLTADHGEAFGEHGTNAHARTVYEEAVHVPFFFYLPGRAPQELDVQVSGIDVGPTVLDLFQLPTPGFWMGQSLLPVVSGTARQLERPLALDTGRLVQALCFDDGRKVIFNRPQHTTEVFDLKQDPKELTNLAASDAPRVKEAIQVGEFFFSQIRRSGDLSQVGD